MKKKISFFASGFNIKRPKVILRLVVAVVAVFCVSLVTAFRFFDKSIDVNASVSVGDNVTVSRTSDWMHYASGGDLQTAYYSISGFTSEDNVFGGAPYAVCAQPNLKTADGNYGPVVNLTDVKDAETARKIVTILAVTNQNNPENLSSEAAAIAMGNNFGSNLTSYDALMNAVSYDIPTSLSHDQKLFVLAHILIGHLYNIDDGYDGYAYVYNTEIFNNLINRIVAVYGSSYTNYVGLVVQGSNPNMQDVVWLKEVDSNSYFRVCKTDTDGNLITGSSATFSIKGNTMNTDPNTGCTEYISVKPNTEFTYQETMAPEGYVSDTTVHTKTLSESDGKYVTENVANELYVTGTVKIKKVDAETGSVNGQGSASIDGSKFGIFTSSTAGDAEYIDLLTIRNGMAVVTGLAPGTYYIWEIEAGTGYNKSSEKKQFTIESSGGSVDLTSQPFKNQVIKGGIKLLKTKEVRDFGPDLFSGVSFNIIDSSGNIVKTITTGADGIASTGDHELPYGKYTVSEVKNSVTAAYWLADDSIVNVNSEGVIVDLGTKHNTLISTPEISSVARNASSPASNPVKVVNNSGRVSIADAVTMTDLVAGSQYRLVGGLYEKESGEQLAGTSAIWTQESGGSQELSFDSVSIDGYAGKTLAVAVRLYVNDNGSWTLIGDHNYDFSDPDQEITVEGATISTVATSDGSSGKTLGVGIVTVYDQVTLNGLTSGRGYVLKAMLKDQSGNTIVMSDGETENSDPFVASSSTTVRNYELKFDSSNYIGQTITVFEYLYDSDGAILVAKHENGANQSVRVEGASIESTTASSNNSDNKTLKAENDTVNDRVVISGLQSGSTYNLITTLHKSDGTVVGTETSSFTASGSSKTVDVSMNINATGLQGQKLTFSQVLKFGDKVIATHNSELNENIGETLTVVAEVTMETFAFTTNANNKIMIAGADTTIKDRVEIHGLITGQTYTLGTKITKRSNGEVIETNIQSVEAESADATVNLSFELDTTGMEGEELAFVQDFKLGADFILTHNGDLQDANEYVSIVGTEITSTVASSNNSDNKTLLVGSDTAKDSVTMNRLKVGGSYTLVTKLHKVSDGSVIDTVETSFVADAETVTKNVSLTVNTAGLQGQELAFSQVLKFGNTEVATHNTELNDADEKLNVGAITMQTVASTDNSDTKILNVGSDTAKDLVKIDGLSVGQTYSLITKLVKRSDGAELKSSTDTFSASGTHEERNISFTLDTYSLQGQEVVFVQVLRYGETELMTHNTDLQDTDEKLSIKSVSLGTTASNNGELADSKKLGVGETKVKDVVHYEGLTGGASYKVKGRLMDKTSGSEVRINGAAITAEKTFVAGNSGEGEVELSFDLDTSSIVGKELVVFEKLYYGEAEIAIHEELEDEAQTVVVSSPNLGTDARAKDDGSYADDEKIVRVGTVTVVDTITYDGLVGGKTYTVAGKVMNSRTGEEVKINGQSITKTATFTAAAGGLGTTQLEYTFDSTTVQGDDLVVFEKLFYGDNLIATHEDLGDEGQKFKVMESRIETLALDGEDDNNIIEPEDGMRIVDTVTYYYLYPGKRYTVKGVIMDQETGEELKVNGEKVEGETTFAASNSGNGTATVEFSVDAEELPGKKMVVFEKLYDEATGLVVAEHEDLSDANQFIKVRERIGTIAADYLDGDQKVGVGNAVLVDTVAYEGLEIDKRYAMVGVLVDKETGEPIKNTRKCIEKPENTGNDLTSGEEDEECVESGEVTSVSYFTVGREDETGEGEIMEKDGYVRMYFGLDTRLFAGKSLVVFEYLYALDDYPDGEPLTVHEDLNDKSQTVDIYDPGIKTSAIDKIDGDKELGYNTITVITDKVTYDGLVPGNTYKLKGTLMDKSTNKKAEFEKASDNEVETTFVARGESGTVDIDFGVNTEGMSGKELVVFEELYMESYDESGREPVLKDMKIAEHKDINDEAQTVWVKVATPETGAMQRGRGGGKAKVFVGGACFLCLVGFGGFMAFKRLKNRRKIGFD